MKIYRLRSSLTYIPFTFLILLSIILAKIYFYNINDNNIIIASILSFMLSLVFIFMSYIKICTTDEYISRLYISNCKHIKWSNIFEVKFGKSTTTGYNSATISYNVHGNNEEIIREYFVIGSWLKEYGEIISELGKKAINAKYV